MENDSDRHDSAEPTMPRPHGLDGLGRAFSLFSRGSHCLEEIGQRTILWPATCLTESANKTPGVIGTTGRSQILWTKPAVAGFSNQRYGKFR